MISVTAFVWSLVVCSLLTRYVVGCYLSVPLLCFAQANLSHGLWAHMISSQRWLLEALVVFLLLTTVWGARQLWRAIGVIRCSGEVRIRRWWLFAWLGLTAGFTLSTAALNQTDDRVFKARMLNHLSYNLDPLITFGLSCYDLHRQAQYESAVLEEDRLCPRSIHFSMPALLQRKPNIIFLQVESFRSDLIGQFPNNIELTPNINGLAAHGTWFKKAYAPASHTSLSSPSIPSSLYPLRKDMLVAYQANDPWPKTLIYDVLKPYGYASARISSDFESWCGMDTFLVTPALDLFVDATTRKIRELQLHPENADPAGVKVEFVPDRVTVDTALEWMDTQIKRHQPFFINIGFNDSHFPYKSSHPDAHWFGPDGVASDWGFGDYPRAAREQVRNTYFNAIHGIDLLIGEVLKFLHEQGVDENTIIAVYGDHGESFYENGLICHATLPYDPGVHTGLILWGKGFFESRIEDYPTSLIDLVPTVLARIGLEAHPNFQGVDALSANRLSADRRCLYLHVDGLVNSDGLVAAGRWKYFEDNGKGALYLFDLESDPGETQNLAETRPEIVETLSAQLATWRTAQLAYYRAARYYERFFPPPPPMLAGAQAARGSAVTFNDRSAEHGPVLQRATN